MRKLTILGAVVALIAAPVVAQQTDLRKSSAVSGTVSVSQATPGTTNGVSVNQINGTTVPTGNGTAATAQRVVVASDNTAFAVTATGNVASGVSDSGSPLKTGCVNNTTLPTVTTGQRVDCQAGTRGSIHFELYGANNANGLSLAAGNTDGVTAGVANDQFGLGRGVNGSGTIDRMRLDANAVPVSKGLSSTRWRYTSGTSPILSNTTTAVTIKSAAGASIRNAIDSCQLTTTAFGASVPLVFRDGAAGTVMWALTVPTAGFLQPVNIVFEQPLVGTANTLIEVATPTADTSGTTTLSCQGHTENP